MAKISQEPKNAFLADVHRWASTHVVASICTLGLAIVGYMIGKLGQRIVQLCKAKGGTAKKVEDVAREALDHRAATKAPKTEDRQPKAEATKVADDDSRAGGGGGGGGRAISNGRADAARPDSSGELASFRKQLKDRILEGYENLPNGWMLVTPKDTIDLSKPFIKGAGGIAFPNDGKWKIHISIDPKQMRDAIPILVDVLFADSAPRLGFKIVSEGNLEGTYQIGKELSLKFDKDIEGNEEIVSDCLTKLMRAFQRKNIKPDDDKVLTPENAAAINATERKRVEKIALLQGQLASLRTSLEFEGIDESVKQKIEESVVGLEKKIENLQEMRSYEMNNYDQGKYDRAIPTPDGANFFHYRNEGYAPVTDDTYKGFQKEPAGVPQGMYSASQIHQLARKNADMAHNPTGAIDPFFNIDLR